MNRCPSFTRAFALATLIGGGLAAAVSAQNWSFPVSPGERLEVDLEPGGDVEIRGVPGSTVTVEATAGGRDGEDYKVVATRTANGVRVRAEMQHRFRSYSIDATVTISVPERFDLDLRSSGGGFRIVGVEGKIDGRTQGGGIELERVRGEVALSSMGGDVIARDVDAAGRVETMGGDVEFVRVRGGLAGKTMGGSVHLQEGDAVELETMGGKVRAERAAAGAKLTTMGGEIEILSGEAPLRASTMGGDLSARVTGGEGEVVLGSMGGDVEVWLPADFPADFDVELSQTRGRDGAYTIESDFPLQRGREQRRANGRGGYDDETVWTAKGTNGRGGSRVKVSTVNGDIRIHRAK